MKRFILYFVVTLFVFPSFLMAEEKYDEEQLKLRTELLAFLKVEGFTPSLDTDGDVQFKVENKEYCISVSSTDSNPFYVMLFRSFEYPSTYSKSTFVAATEELNLYKGVKIVCLKRSFKVAVEMYVKSAEAIKEVFYKMVSNIDLATSDILSECEKVEKSVIAGSVRSDFTPFLITDIEIGNVDVNGHIIQGYGAIIPSYKAQYLKPRITIKNVNQSGSFTVRVKVYLSNVLQRSSSSPADCTYTDTIKLKGGIPQVKDLAGWGRNSVGWWKSGDYRFEFWYGNYCIGSKSFNIL